MRWVAVVLLAAVGGAPAIGAQGPPRPTLEWRTLETQHFSFHYPRDLEAWTRDVATHMESVDSAVARLVGYAPPGPIQVVVDDPYNDANGSALPFIDSPVLTFWAVPPTPRDDIGDWRSWGEMLSVHEFAHLAHLTRPTRNPVQRLLWSLLPAEIGPLVRKAPRWVMEGYATFVEGRITGSGRPNGAARAAVLREWALEGRVPGYDQLNGSGAFEGGSFPYLFGSAFLEWLARREGDSSLVALWRRASARVDRTFDEAFVGVYGDAPRALYGRFTAELTASATDAVRALDARGRVEGDLIQHLVYSTGDPAVSPDGRRVAVVLKSPALPSRVAVWYTADEPFDSAAAKAREALLRLDSLDVPARQFYPQRKRALATLRARAGQPYVQPRFLADGTRLLLTRSTPRGDGSFRPDLYVWDIARNSVRRVTAGASVADADPAPDGRTAIATRCERGTCDVVRVDLATGAVATVLLGDPRHVYYHPRFAPDGRRFVVSLAEGGAWHLVLSAPDGNSAERIGPDDGANRFDAVFRPSGDTLVYGSDRGGIVNIEELDMRSGRERALTRVSGAAVAPAVNAADGSVWFLALHAGGYDVRRLPATVAAGDVVSVTGAFGAAAPPVPVARELPSTGAVGESRDYGMGPRHTRVLPGFRLSADGAVYGLTGVNGDVVGRLTVIGNAALGARSASSGGSLAASWRPARIALEAGVHWARQQPSLGSAAGPVGVSLDETRFGGLVAGAFQIQGDGWSWRTRAGGGAERVSTAADTNPFTRALGFAEWTGALRQSGDAWGLVERLAVHVDAGRSAEHDVARLVAHAGFGTLGAMLFPFSVAVAYGRESGSTSPAEHFSAGGLAPLIDSSLTTSGYAAPWLPTGAASVGSGSMGSSLLAYRVLVPVGLLDAFYEGASVNSESNFRAWHRGVGAEYRVTVGAFAAAYLPVLQVRVGGARSLDWPFAGRSALYSAVQLTP
jgi:hypothetical protein